MAVRSFDGTADFVTLAIGGLVGINNGASSCFALLKRGVDAAWHAVISAETSGGNSVWNMIINDSNTVNIEIGDSEVSGGSLTAALDWVVAGFTRASAGTPRIHVYRYDLDSWAHNNASGALADDATSLTGGSIKIGRWQTTDDYQGLIGLVAAFDDVPFANDAAVEAAGLETALSNWLAASPVGCWKLNQTSTSVDVVDLTVGGADQTALSGTTVETADDPAFDFEEAAAAGVPLRPSTPNRIWRTFR